MFKNLSAQVHDKLIFQRRVHQLIKALNPLFKQGEHILDVGCGDGLIDKGLLGQKPSLSIEGVDILKRPQTHIEVKTFDGKTLPFADKSFDVVMFVDVLHHTQDPKALILEAKRVARKALVIKDHCQDGFLAAETLRFMDFVGNAPYGVALRYNYLSLAQWQALFSDLELEVGDWQEQLRLYPLPASLIFDRKLHFIARLRISHS
ncbi:MAG: methyltransferase domain-containing protein [Deinococcales bacterium]